MAPVAHRRTGALSFGAMQIARRHGARALFSPHRGIVPRDRRRMGEARKGPRSIGRDPACAVPNAAKIPPTSRIGGGDREGAEVWA
jgi:hypothetical protein